MGIPDFDIVGRAVGNHGVVTRRELVDDLGLTAATISRRVSSGHLRPVRRGVYVVASMERDHSVAAALARSLGAVVSHESAASLHRMPIAAPRPTVTVEKGRHVDVDGARIVESRFMPRCDQVVIDGIVATTAARTLCDLAVALRPQHLRQLVQQQTLDGRPDMGALIACHQALARRGRAGTTAMRALLSDLTDDEPYPASRLEALVANELARRRVKGIRRQFAPPWYDGFEGIVDFADPTGRTIIEADGRAWHTLDRHATRDRQRNRLAAANDWIVVRVGWAELTERTESTMDELVTIIGARRRTSGR